MKKIKTTILNLGAMIFILVLPFLVLAQGVITEAPESALSKLERVGSEFGPYDSRTDGNTVFKSIGLIINLISGFLSVVFLFLIIYAGMKWMTANGVEEEVRKAKQTLKQAAIGLLVVIGAWGIWALIVSLFLNNLG